MTIEKATTMHNETNLILSNHGVRKFWIYWTLLLNHLDLNYQIYLGLSYNLDGNLDKWHSLFFSFKQGRKIVDFMEYSRYFQTFPETQAMLTQRQRKFELFNPSQAKPRLRSKHSEVQQCSLTQWLHNQTSCTCAALQHSGRGAAQRSSRHAAAAGRLRSISLVCLLHNTITLTLRDLADTQTLLSKIDTFTQECG